MADDDSPKIEIERKDNPELDAIDDRIADLVAEALYQHILRKGILKKGNRASNSENAKDIQNKH